MRQTALISPYTTEGIERLTMSVWKHIEEGFSLEFSLHSLTHNAGMRSKKLISQEFVILLLVNESTKNKQARVCGNVSLNGSILLFSKIYNVIK